ncbi:MAG: hypothetical protein ACI4UE_05105 [Candidatus Scatovivens sp.]
MNKKEIPVVKVFKTENENQCSFWCPYCKKYHYHGIPLEGHRTAHCTNKNSPFRETGYILKEYTKKELQELGLHKK